MILRLIKVLSPAERPKRRTFHPMWCPVQSTRPYIAVNEFELQGVADSAAIRSRLVPHVKHRALPRCDRYRGLFRPASRRFARQNGITRRIIDADFLLASSRP